MEPVRRDEFVRLWYFEWKLIFAKVKLYKLYINVPNGFPVTNFTHVQGQEETIYDMRGQEEFYTLDQHGFAVKRDNMSLQNFDKATIESCYLEQVEALLRKEVDDVSEVFFRLESKHTRGS